MIVPVTDATVDPVRPLLVPAHIARELLGNISDRTLFKITAPQGPIQCVRIGGDGSPRLYPVAELDRYVADQIELAWGKQKPPKKAATA